MTHVKEVPQYIFGQLNQVKCYEVFNHKKILYERAHLSIIQFLVLLSSQLHFKMLRNNTI